MKTVVWALGWPIACAASLVAHKYAYGTLSENQLSDFNESNVFIWLIGIILCTLTNKDKSK